MKELLIGGSRDGEWEEDRGYLTIQCSVAVATPGEAAPIFSPTFRRETYRREILYEAKNAKQAKDIGLYLAVYIHESLTTQGALLRLLHHYRPEKK